MAFAPGRFSISGSKAWPEAAGANSKPAHSLQIQRSGPEGPGLALAQGLGRRRSGEQRQ